MSTPGKRQIWRFMRQTALCASILTICACAATPQPVVLPPEIIKVPIAQPLPLPCRELQKVELPAGSTAMDVMEKQHKAILAYEGLIKNCFK